MGQRKEVVIYALFCEPDCDLDSPDQPFIIFDGIEKDSLLHGPQDFLEAARQNWEPDTWMIAIDWEKLHDWPQINLAENKWLEIRFIRQNNSTTGAHLYISRSNQMDASSGIEITSILEVPETAIRAKLENFARLEGVPSTSEKEIRKLLEDALCGINKRMFLAFDVGQGNWNAVVDATACPRSAPVIRLFYDCGVAIGLHENSLPTPPINPFTRARDDAPVVLSHWDMDHWAGAALGQPLFGNKGIKIKWNLAAINRKWIVPNQGKKASGQRISSTGWRLALALHRAGNLLIWPPGLLNLQLASGDWLIQCRPSTGKGDNNNTGLALLVKTPRLDGSDAYTLAAGDAEYSSLLPQCPPLHGHTAVLTGLVASHHGGKISCNPPQAIARWSKLAFSHGAKYGHLTSESKKDHREFGWRHQYETHTRKRGTLHGGVKQEVGTISLGGHQVTLDALRDVCLSCAARNEICPVQ